MTRRHFEFIKTEPDEYHLSIGNVPAFEQNLQTALLLSLLQRRLLNQWQFDKCLDELKKDKGA